MINVNKFLNGIFTEGLVDGDIADGDAVDTTKADGVDFEDTLAGVIADAKDCDISELSDHNCTCDGICKESVVNVDGVKYRVQVSVVKI